jgi:hypothetical protein
MRIVTDVALVPKLRLGTPVGETPFRIGTPPEDPSPAGKLETEFRGVRSQTYP